MGVTTMSNMKNVLRALLAITSLALSLPGPAQAQVDRDTQEISSYVLTEAGLARFTKASKALGALRKELAGGCEEEDGDNARSIDQLVAKFNATPGAKAALQGAGMTTREFIVFSMSIFQTGLASWGLSQPGGKLPPGMSMANINFYRQHETAMAGLNKDSESDDCNAEEPEDEPSE
jgi:hypothetical protein